jgi:phage tail-like protein
MAVMRDKPYSNYNFLVDLGTGDSSGIAAGFSEVVIPPATLDVIEYRSGNDEVSEVRKIPGRAHYGNLVLKRGIIGSLNLYQWWNDVRNGDVNAGRNITVHLQNEDRTTIVLTWKFLHAWPMRYEFCPLEAKGKETLVETLELAFERMEME